MESLDFKNIGKNEKEQLYSARIAENFEKVMTEHTYLVEPDDWEKWQQRSRSMRITYHSTAIIQVSFIMLLYGGFRKWRRKRDMVRSVLSSGVL